MNYAYLDLPSKQEIRRKTLKALCLPGRQIPFSAPELPIAYGWGGRRHGYYRCLIRTE